MKRASILALIILLCGFSSAQQSYTFEQIVIPASTYTIAKAINGAGGIVGVYGTNSGTSNGFAETAKKSRSIIFPNARFTSAEGINRGEIVGFFIGSRRCGD